jgi:hypothetical protein
VRETEQHGVGKGESRAVSIISATPAFMAVLLRRNEIREPSQSELFDLFLGLTVLR